MSGGTLVGPLYYRCTNSRCQVIVAITFCVVVPDHVFVDPQYGTGFMSAFWYLGFFGGS
jgi:hypothetical protein